jgi:hypothetical protein
MAKDTLRVLPRGTAMVMHYERTARHGQPASYHGWKHDSLLGDEYVDPEFSTKDKKVVRRDGGFVKHAPEVIEVPNSVEYRRALVDLSLWPADQATAQEAGVPFDPTFGGEEELAHHVAPLPKKTSYSPALPAEKV